MTPEEQGTQVARAEQIRRAMRQLARDRFGLRYDWPATDHLTDDLQDAIDRFAAEDGCTPEEWAGRAVRYAAAVRYFGEHVDRREARQS